MYSVNMPNWDDYDAILDWLNFNVTNHDAAKFFQILFSQATEHRIVFDRLVTLIYYYLFKSVNFSILTFLGLLGQLAILLLLLKIAFKSKFTLLELIPLPYMLFSLSQWELLSWAMASLSQYWQLFFALIAIYLAVNLNNFKGMVLAFLFFKFFSIYSSWWINRLSYNSFILFPQQKI